MLPVDEVGKVYGRLSVLSRSGSNRSRQATWFCLCECGGAVTTTGERLRSGLTTSCGCAQRDAWHKVITTHGKEGHPAVVSYRAAKGRCTNPNNEVYRHYGGRGIQFLLPPIAEFLELMLPQWKPGLTLDRIDVDANYEIGNVRWATRETQANNKRNNTVISYNGEALTLAQWAKKLGIGSASLLTRLAEWPLDRALTSPRVLSRKGEHNRPKEKLNDLHE